MQKEQVRLAYSFDNVDPTLGINVFQAGKFLESMGRLVKESNRLIGIHDREVSINIKPSSEGSFIQEFLIVWEAADKLISSDPDLTLYGVLQSIGLIGGPNSLLNVVSSLRGLLLGVEKVGSDEYHYHNNENHGIIVNGHVNILIQSPEIKKEVRNIFVSTPGSVDPKVTPVTTYDVEDPDNSKVHFGEDELQSIKRYTQRDVPVIEGDIEESVSVSTLRLRPRQGSYMGSKSPYSFFCGDDVMSNVKMGDLGFLEKLNRGIVKFHKNDDMLAEVETIHRLGINHHTITKVIQHEPNSQLEMFGEKNQ